MMHHQSGPSRRLTFLTVTLVFLVGFVAARLPATLAQLSGKGDTVDAVREVYSAIMAGAVDPPDTTKLRNGAIAGMLEALEDDYAEYIPAEDAAMFEKEMTGQFSGIGCQIEMRDGWLTVVTPLEDSPAFNAGIMAGDRISKIGDKSTFGLSTDECIKMLTGPPGTEVSFTVTRDGADVPYTLTRAPITSKTVRGLTRTADGSWNFLIDPDQRIAYLRLSQFTPTASEELAGSIIKALEQTNNRGFGGMILDLRNNPGGVMEGAIEIVDMFIKDGSIMSIRGRAMPKIEFTAEADGTLPDFPLVVIVNGGSASASEIVAGALQDRGRAIVVGERTFGKGLVQTVARLRSEPGAEVKFTTQRYYLPSGRLIQRSDDSTEWGVDPSPGFYVPMSDREQLESFLKRREWDVLRKAGAPHVDPAGTVPLEQRWTDPEWIRTEALDRQLAAALEAVHTRISTSEWKAVSDEVEPHGKLAVNEIKDLQKERRQLGLEFARIEKRLAALRKQAEGGPEAAPERLDLWSDTIDPTGGHLDVTDKDGRPIARLRITGRNVEGWLLNADVEPADSSSSRSDGADPAPPAGQQSGSAP